MDQGSLVIKEIDAGGQLAREFASYVPVQAAFWLKATDEDQRYLYLASDQIDDHNFDVAYGEILRLTSKMNSPFLDPFRVKLINVQHPLAQAAMDIHRRFSGPLGTRYGGKTFGGLSVDDVFVYPASLLLTVP